ncbi:MAG: hypothetical protein CVV22_13065 [Ignavibacteriae bacterium HGW-Ignavibacteriae-1]|jgi:hypothetical protein|nr:MAG: hypothetical protein CVV22_13065 [Ignavibacteriae bacterium HGW-Ignavibacteriae-1]
MKIFLILVLLALSILAYSANAQRHVHENDHNHKHDHEHPCGTMEYLKKQIQENPNIEILMKQYEEQTQRMMKDAPGLQSNGTVTIPVVVHILYNTESQNISDERVFQQIQQLNEDFAGLNPNPMGEFSPLLKVNTGIKFCLAQTAPDGSPTNGIQRRQNVPVFYYPDNGMKFYRRGGLDAWDPNFYLNIWVCPMQGVGAFGQFPGSGINETYGVATNPDLFGKSPNTGFDKGHLLAHEVGHCFNLRHIWADDGGACTGSDLCEDTPNQGNFIRGDHRGILTDDCTPTSPGVMYMNFMDYVYDDTYSNFTPDQNARMWASLNGPLLSLTTSTVCNPPSGCESPMNLKATSINQTNAVLNWVAMVNSATYNIRYRKANRGSWTTITSVTNSIYISGLQKNTSYEFQVQAVYVDCSSDFSYIESFKTPQNNPPTTIAVPSLVSPANNEVNVSITSTLSWNSVSNAQGYTLQYSENSDFSYPYFQKTFSGTSFVSRLSFNTKYYWRVRAETSDIIGDWSEVRTFTTETGTLNAPVQIKPLNNSQNVAIDPSLIFVIEPVTNARRYIYQYSINSDMTEAVEPLYNCMKGLAKGTKYYWRVKAVNNDITSDWSEIWNFTTDDGTLVVPTLSSPANNAINVEVNPVLYWNSVANATEYTLQYSINNDLTDSVSIITSNSSININSLNYETSYFWRVKAANSDTASEWSEIWSFTTGSMALDAPALSSPTDNSQNVSRSPTLSWNSVNGATSYNLQYSTSSNFSTYSEVTGITNTSWQISSLSKRTTYYWRVNAQNESITSEWSTEWQFKTSNNNKLSAEDDFTEYNAIVNFHSYPNPFTDETTIEFTLPEQSEVTVKVYNLQGNLVNTLHEGMTSAGLQMLKLSTRNFPAGEYSIVLTFGSEQFIHKVMKEK